MRITRIILASAIFATTVAVQPVSAAQSIAVTSGVTVIRGVEDPADRKAGQTTRERGVSVFRGNPTPYAYPEPAERDEAEVQVITGGNNLWLVNQQTGEITACELRPNVDGQLSVACSGK